MTMKKAMITAEGVIISMRKSMDRRMREKREADRARPVGTRAVETGFYSRAEADKPIDNIRWSVWLVRWDGSDWRHVRRLTGPLPYEAMLDRLNEIMEQRGLPRAE